MFFQANDVIGFSGEATDAEDGPAGERIRMEY
jgi:hypothetical protein